MANKEYPDFIKSTGYGLVDGLHGANCRHSYSPFYPGISTPRWTPEELNEYADKTYTFTGADGKDKTVGAYEASQIQRGLEREVRAWKRRIAVKETAGPEVAAEAGVDNDKQKLKYWQKRLSDFTNETGLRRQHSRERIAKR